LILKDIFNSINQTETLVNEALMISYVHLGVADLGLSFAFYAPLMAELGLPLRFHDTEKGWAGWASPSGGRPLLLIGRPFDGAPPAPGNGTMLALSAGSRDVVDRCHALALELGGRYEGAPALRPQYHASYYGAYFRDPDGNKLCVVCHVAAG
jgi:catechol 2,3-dioxygenase-like lactoylglutathione lyase family enzyme